MHHGFKGFLLLAERLRLFGVVPERRVFEAEVDLR